MEFAQKPFGQIVSQIEDVGRLVDQIATAGSSRMPVLISGPRSTGADLVGKAIHLCSPRSSRPFVTVRCNGNCQALLDFNFLLDGEKAESGRRGPARACGGKLQCVNGGTLFIDQVQSAAPAVQSELLRFITDNEYVDSEQGEVQVADVRFVLSAWIDLKRRSEQGQFRSDLYDRISMVTLEVRRGCSTKEWFFEVIELLRQVVLAREAYTRLPLSLVAQINKYSWSPHVQSLHDAIRAIVQQGQDSNNPEEVFFSILTAIGHRRVEGLAEQYLRAVNSTVEKCVEIYEAFGGHMYDTLLGQIQKTLIRRTMIQCNGTLSRAADILGVSTNVLETKVQELGLR